MSSSWEPKRILHLLPRAGSLSAYALAILLVGLGVLVRFPLDEIATGPLPPYITLYPMIVIAAFAGGIKVGAFAAAMSAVTAWWLWVLPPTSAPDAGRIATAVVFVFTAAITVSAVGLARTLLDRVAESQEVQARTARESVHRIKNLIAVVQAISRKISASADTVESYKQSLDERLHALAASQDMLLKREWEDVPLTELVQTSLGPFIANPKLELRLAKECVAPAAIVTSLGMALYELATNSMKYGALMSPNGAVVLESRIFEGMCSLDWREVGLAHVAMGESAGLGASLIRAALRAIDGGSVRYNVSPNAVTCLFEWACEANRKGS